VSARIGLPRAKQSQTVAVMTDRGIGLDLAWRREVVKPSVRALLSLALTGREKGLTENGISRNSLSTMEHGKVEIGAEILLRISREFGKSIEWQLTG